MVTHTDTCRKPSCTVSQRTTNHLMWQCWGSIPVCTADRDQSVDPQPPWQSIFHLQHSSIHPSETVCKGKDIHSFFITNSPFSFDKVFSAVYKIWGQIGFTSQDNLFTYLSERVSQPGLLSIVIRLGFAMAVFWYNLPRHWLQLVSWSGICLGGLHETEYTSLLQKFITKGQLYLSTEIKALFMYHQFYDTWKITIHRALLHNYQSLRIPRTFLQK